MKTDSCFADSPLLPTDLWCCIPASATAWPCFSAGRRWDTCWWQKGRGRKAALHKQSSACFLLDWNHRPFGTAVICPCWVQCCWEGWGSPPPSPQHHGTLVHTPHPWVSLTFLWSFWKWFAEKCWERLQSSLNSCCMDGKVWVFLSTRRLFLLALALWLLGCFFKLATEYHHNVRACYKYCYINIRTVNCRVFFKKLKVPSGPVERGDGLCWGTVAKKLWDNLPRESPVAFVPYKKLQQQPICLPV